MFPEIMQVQMNSFCTGSCLYCPYPQTSREQPMGQMPKSTIKEIITEFVDKGGKFLIPYLQNEPLFDPRFLSMLDFTRNMSDIPIEVSTNCTLLASHIREKLVTYSNMQFVLHLNSFTSIAAESARLFLELNPERVLVSLFRGYISDEDAELWFRYGEEKGVLVKLFSPCNRAGNVNIKDVKPHFLRRLFNSFRSKSCMTLRSQKWIHVLWDGSVVLCCQDWRRAVVLGNVSNDSIEEVFNNVRFNQVRPYVSGINTPKEFLCRKCNFWVNHDTSDFEKIFGKF